MSSKSKVLGLLEQNRGAYVSGAELAKEIAISRSGVWKIINELKKEGYDITAVTNKGYRLEMENDLLSIEGMTPYLEDDVDKNKILLYKTIDSTNNEAKRLSLNGAKANTVILSEEQSGGKGRLGRSFYSPKGSGVYLSILLHPKVSAEKSILVTTAASVVVCRAVEEISEKPCQIKWVNDVYCGGKKICGILTEAVTNFETGNVESIVLGIGVNFKRKENEFPEEIRHKAGAIFQEHTGGVTRNQLAAAMINRLMHMDHMLETGDFIEEYKHRSLVLGKEVQLVSGSENRTATVLDIDETGGLIVRYPDGNQGVIRSGEVSVRGLFSKE